MTLTVEQIEKIIKASEKAAKSAPKEIQELVCCFVDLVKAQTNIKDLNLVKKVIDLYKSCKNNAWFKEGLKHVLLNGSFPENTVELIREIPHFYPAKQWPDPEMPKQPYVGPNQPIISFNDVVGSYNLVVDFLENK